jgi:hypothetical protein
MIWCFYAPPLCAQLLDRVDSTDAGRFGLLARHLRPTGRTLARASGYASVPIFDERSNRGPDVDALGQKPMRRLRSFATLALFAALCACAPQAQTDSVAIPKIPAGLGRAWFYREDLPYSGFDRPYVRMNGAVVGISELGGAFYRDVSPGEYYVTVDSYRHFINQFPHVNLLPGETVYFQIFEVGGGASAWKNYARPSFYVWTMPATIAGSAVARSVFYAGGG